MALGHLSQDFDTARATSLESYERTANVYDLTPGGEAAAEALAAFDEALRRVGGLQAVALRHAEEMLGQLVSALRADKPEGERIFGLCPRWSIAIVVAGRPAGSGMPGR